MVQYIIYEKPAVFSDKQLEEEIWDDIRIGRKEMLVMEAKAKSFVKLSVK